MKNNIIYVSLLTLGLISCQSEFENEINSSTYYSGDADLRTYVAVGNSLTAGYMDGTIFRTGQQNSFPNLLSNQFKVVGGGEFTQPSFEQDVNDLGGLLLGGNQIAGTRLIINAAAGGPENITGVPQVEVSDLQQKAYHNMGVPGAKSFHLLASGYGNLAGVATGQANPFFVRHATSPSTTVLADALSMNPTFFTNWIGSNDVLAYATSGGVGVDQTGNYDPATYGGTDITDPNVFANVYSNIIDALTANGAKGVVATVPSVTSIPFFTTVPYAPLSSEDQNFSASIPELQTLYGVVNQIYAALNITGRNLVVNTEGYTPLLIKDESLTDVGASLQAAAMASGNPLLESLAPLLAAHFGQVRQATANDLILLTTRSVIGKPAEGIPAPLNLYGITFPLEDSMVLTQTEVTLINTATAAYNNTIRTVAQSKGLAVADMNEIMNKLVQGLRTADNQIYTANYFTPSRIHTTLFSLDGVHPNAKGYAVIANEIIKVINMHYNAHIPQIDVSKYPTIKILTSN
ncbi:MAG: G-D-S-L family lipolytic protein [Bacteroidota bacterium]|nr:G-D-S-L family lipolytic protein [Bacteroidota bacterium]